MKKLLIILLVLVSGFSFGQQDPLYNQYMFNPLVLNPAYAGSREAISTVLLHRSQWVGIEGAPGTQTLSIHSPFMQGKVGLGATLIHDNFGPNSSTGILGSYAYRLFMDQSKLAFGLRTSVYNYKYNWDEVEYRDAAETASLTGTTAEWVMSFDFGMRYYTRKFYAGLTLLYLNNPKLDLGATATDSSAYNSSLARHVNITLGRAFEYSKDIVFRPSLMFKATDRFNKVLDINFSVLFKKTLWVGFSYRTTQSLVLIAEYNITDKFRAGYSFDLTLSKLRKVNSGSHELFIGYDLTLLKHKPKLVSPRVYF